MIDRFFARLIQRGQLTIITRSGRRVTIGQPDPAFAPVTLHATDARTSAAIMRNPALAAGEAYMDGRLRIEGDDIRALLELAAANMRWDAPGAVKQAGRLAHVIKGWRRRLHQRNQPARARRNVAHHYDLSDRLYDLFLDRDRQYSCAYFRDPSDDLDDAQHAKKAHIAAKLRLCPGQRVLDIGCGWGGMALYLHQIADVDVLGITLSAPQLAVARRRAAEAGVADRVTFELMDYRAVTGRFDRIVSVGMFEHVGAPNYPAFFARCRTLLAADGVVLLHTIGRMGGPSVTDAFTEKYIFPGGYSPALSEIMAAVEGARLIASDIETLRLHYAWTLDRWYDRVRAHRAEIEALYDDRFYRLWSFYLAGAATAFRWGDHCNYQLQLIRQRDATPVTRDYIGAAERALLAGGTAEVSRPRLC